MKTAEPASFTPQGILLWMLGAYKRWISPQLPAACRFTPNCSEYAAEAVARHGALAGVSLALWRLLRCHPLGGRGLDPVPEEWSCSHRTCRTAARGHGERGA